MVDVRAVEPEGQAKDDAAARRLAALKRWEDDARLADSMADALKARHEDLWVGACKGDVHVRPTLRALLESFDALGRPEVEVPITYVSADGRTKVIR